MTLTEIYTILTGITGYSTKVTYYAWPEGQAPALPFICYVETGSSNFAADGKVYHSNRKVDIELYSKQKSLTDESLVETALNTAGIYWEKSEQYLTDEQCHEVIYTVEV